MKLPSGPGAPAADAADALARRRPPAAAFRTLTAEVAASGKVGGQRFRARLFVGVPPARPRGRRSARSKRCAVRPAALHPASTNDDATLLLPRDDACSSTAAPPTCSTRWPACR